MGKLYKNIIALLGILLFSTNAYAADPKANRIVFTPVGTVSATNVQAAIQEVDSEKLAAETNNLETVTTGIAVDEVPVGTAADDVTYKVIADCDGNGSALNYDTTGHAFSCKTLADADMPDSATVTGWTLGTASITELDLADNGNVQWGTDENLTFNGTDFTLTDGLDIAGNIVLENDETISNATNGMITIDGIIGDNDDLIFEIDADSNGTESLQVGDGAGTIVAELTEAGALQLDSDLTIGANGDVDHAINFDANTSDGKITWMEDEKELRLFSGAAGVDYILGFDGETNDGAITYDEDLDGIKIDNIFAIGGAALNANYMMNFAKTYDDTLAIYGIWGAPTISATDANASGGGIAGYALVFGDSYADLGAGYYNSSGLIFGSYVFGGNLTDAAGTGRSAGKFAGIQCFGIGAWSTTIKGTEATGLYVQPIGNLGGFGYAGTFDFASLYGIKIVATDEVGGAPTTTADTEIMLNIELPTEPTAGYQIVLEGSGNFSGIWFNGTTGIRQYNDGTHIIIADATSYLMEVGRGTSDTDATYIALKSTDGTTAYIYPNSTENGIVVSTTHP
jgi:hypothetical protein